MSLNPTLRMGPPAVKGFSVYPIEAIKLKVSLGNFIPEHFGEPHIFKFMKPPAPRRKYKDFGSSMTEDEKFHVTFKDFTPPLVVFPLHIFEVSTRSLVAKIRLTWR